MKKIGSFLRIIHLFFIFYPDSHASPLPYEWTCQPINARAVALIAHGLNLNPEKMRPLAKIYCESGVAVINLRLSGHRGIPREFGKVSATIWRGDFDKAYEELDRFAGVHGIPKLFLGYSLGAVLGLDGVSRTHTRFEQMVLLSPPIKVTNLASLIQITFLLPDLAIIPSQSPASYRANPGTSVAAYKSLFEIIESLKKCEIKIHNPIVVLVDPQDELVDAKYLEKLKNHYPKSIILENISAQATEGQKTYHHLLIDQRSAGNEAWEKIHQVIRGAISPYTSSGPGLD